MDVALVTHGLDATLAALEVLEIGCGLGRLAALLAPRACSDMGHAFAWDEAREVARRALGPSAEVTRLDPAHLYLRLVRGSSRRA